MDGSRFDALARALAESGSRRRALGGFLAGALALLSGHEVAAKKCKQKDKKKRRKCRKKASQTPTAAPVTLPPDATFVGQAPPPPPEEIPATCSDGSQNGSESDVDCGGPDCLRCGVGQSCFGQTDCASALCVNNVCTACSATNACGSDSNGPCNCSEGSCSTSSSRTTVAICADCPPYSRCVAFGPDLVCFAPCGSA
jgi:hypothetical protein